MFNRMFKLHFVYLTTSMVKSYSVTMYLSFYVFLSGFLPLLPAPVYCSHVVGIPGFIGRNFTQSLRKLVSVSVYVTCLRFFTRMCPFRSMSTYPYYTYIYTHTRRVSMCFMGRSGCTDDTRIHTRSRVCCRTSLSLVRHP